MKEHLVRFHLKDGEIIDVHKENGDVTLSNKHHQVTISRATGQQALDLFAFFEPLGETIEFPDEAEEGES